MKLTEIGLHVSKSENFSLRETGGALSVIEAMYIYHLVNYQTDGVRRVSIKLTTDLSMQNLMLPLESVLLFSTFFDADKYNSSDIYNRKLIGLDIIIESLLYIAGKRGWAKDPLLDAYNACISKNLEFEATYKNKYYQSPDRKHFATLYYQWGAEKFEAFAIFYNRKKEEIQRKKILECEATFVRDFSYVGWDKEFTNLFIIRQKYPDRLFTAELTVS